MGIDRAETSRRSGPNRQGGRQGAQGFLDFQGSVGLPDRDTDGADLDPTALWRVPLPSRDRLVLEQAFERDPDLQADVGLVLGGLVELGVQGVFVREFVSRVREMGPRVPPALSVLPAASVAIEAVAWRP